MYRVLILALAILIATPCRRRRRFARAMESGDAAVAQKATPAVVNISTWKCGSRPSLASPPRRVKTYGSGFIIDPGGIIVTNKHVIDGALDIKVIFDNGDRVTGKLVAVAAMLDLAVLKVDVDRPLPALKWGNSEAPAGRRRRAGDRQSARARHVGVGGDRQRAEPRHPGHAVRQLHPDRCGDQSRQFRRSDGRSRTARWSGSTPRSTTPRRPVDSSGSGSRSRPKPRKFVVEPPARSQASQARLDRCEACRT